MYKSNHIPRQFYRDLQKWIEQGCPTDNLYGWSTKRGICAAWRDWGTYYKRQAFCRDLESVFDAAGLDKFTPFNPPEYGIHYWKETYKFDNPARLTWIKEHCR